MYILLLNRLECHSRALWDSKKRVDFVSDITVGGEEEIGRRGGQGDVSILLL